MKRNLWMLLALAGFSMVASAAPNFAGSWVRDAKSDTVPNTTALWLTRSTEAQGGAAGGRGNNNNGARVEQVMTVQQNGNTLEVTDPQGTIRKFTLDGKAATRMTETFIQKATVTAAVQGETLVIATTQPYGGMPGNATLNVKEVWTLSADGKTLTVTTTRSSPAEEKTYRQTFMRK